MIDLRALSAIASIVILVSLVEQSSAAASFAFKHSPDCTAILSKSTFFAYDIVCKYITQEWKNDEIPPMEKDANKWDIIETCTCNLLSHELAWAALITHEGEALYLTIQKYIDDYDGDEEHKSDMGRTEMMFQEPGGLRMYYWDRLDDILSNKMQGDEDFDGLMLALMRNFASIYYDPETFTHRYQRQSGGQTVRKVISATCNRLLEEAFVYFIYFDKLRRLAENDRLLYRMTAYSEDLHKLRMIFRLCKTLKMTDQLIATQANN